MEYGKLIFPLPEADFLKQIKFGQIPLEQIDDIYNTAKNMADEAYNNSSLPANLDQNKVWQLYQNIVMSSKYIDEPKSDYGDFSHLT